MHQLPERVFFAILVGVVFCCRDLLLLAVSLFVVLLLLLLVVPWCGFTFGEIKLSFFKLLFTFRRGCAFSRRGSSSRGRIIKLDALHGRSVGRS